MSPSHGKLFQAYPKASAALRSLQSDLASGKLREELTDETLQKLRLACEHLHVRVSRDDDYGASPVPPRSSSRGRTTSSKDASAWMSLIERVLSDLSDTEHVR